MPSLGFSEGYSQTGECSGACVHQLDLVVMKNLLFSASGGMLRCTSWNQIPVLRVNNYTQLLEQQIEDGGDFNNHHHKHVDELPLRALMVGLIHGLAGSAALSILA